MSAEPGLGRSIAVVAGAAQLAGTVEHPGSLPGTSAVREDQSRGRQRGGIVRVADDQTAEH